MDEATQALYDEKFDLERRYLRLEHGLAIILGFTEEQISQHPGWIRDIATKAIQEAKGEVN